jgi:hypothetical protein
MERQSDNEVTQDSADAGVIVCVSPANIPYSRIVLVFADLPFELQRIA